LVLIYAENFEFAVLMRKPNFTIVQDKVIWRRNRKQKCKISTCYWLFIQLSRRQTFFGAAAW